MANQHNTLAHTKWMCKYHIVFIPKYRRKVIYNQLRKLSNAFCENINGKINTYLDISRGINNFKRFRKRVPFALHPKIFYSITDVLYSDKREGKKRGPYKKIKE